MNQEAMEWIMGAALTLLCFVVIPALGFILAAMNRAANDNANEISDLKARVAGIETDIHWIKSSVKVMANKMGDVLHSPHTPEFDKLIEAFWHGEITRCTGDRIGRQT